MGFFLGVVILLQDVSFGEVRQQEQQEKETEKIVKQSPCEKRAIFENGENVCLEIADTPRERQQGLSGRRTLREDMGMLFVFEREFQPSMWMKDMNFALDFVWIDEQGVIRDIHTNVTPETYPRTFSPKEEVQFVLELLSGGVDRYSLEEGKKILFE